MSGGSGPSERSIYLDASDRRADGLVSVDASLEVSACTPAAAGLLGAAESALVGRSIWDLLPDADGTVVETAVEAALEGGRRGAFAWYDARSGTWFDACVYPAEDGLTLRVAERGADGVGPREGRPATPSGGSAGVGAWRIELPDETLHVSEEVLRTRGLPPDYDLTLEEGIQFYHPEDRPVMRAAVERLKTAGETYDLELREVSTDGEVYWVRTTGVPEYDGEGNVTALRGVYREITERKEDEMERERRTREVQRQNERLDDFANVVSHDLRNPLNVAQGRLALARREVESDHHDAIEGALARMDRLIEDVLDLARHGRAVGDPEPVDLTGAVAECFEAAGESDARLVVEDDLRILADGSRLDRLLSNLVGNALEHGGEDVTVTVGGLDDGFYLEDDGPGIPPDRREAVFQSGYSTSPKGTGLGLPIVGEIAAAHQWRVRLVEPAGGGTRFEFTGVDVV